MDIQLLMKPEYDKLGRLVLRYKGEVIALFWPHNLGYACDHDGAICSDDFRCSDCGSYVWYWAKTTTPIPTRRYTPRRG